ncbi:hypothetical protein [Aureimonas sp. Leaf324]|uniref:hypothetical protein n=1 Tax=Aureimonas sp. Leaf324 TaxID=1736336 RepID=UPI0006F97E1C|nr:hypothetical protein [Aureimonas sp. Leaf324]KQQ85853.1 hypothetical protein ASF65_04770 [Aureimonas sp. Leaf324]
MSPTVDEFLSRCTQFARLHPAAVLAMPEPELAVDPRAPAHHLRRTRERARARMVTTARLSLKPTWATTPDLFTAMESATACP